MDAGFNIYELPSVGLLSDIQKEDQARRDGYLHARAEADAPNRAERRRMEKEIRKLRKRLGEES